MIKGVNYEPLDVLVPNKAMDKFLDVEHVLGDVSEHVHAIRSNLSLASKVKEFTGSYTLDAKFVELALYNSMCLIDFVDKLYHELVDLSFKVKGASDGKQ